MSEKPEPYIVEKEDFSKLVLKITDCSGCGYSFYDLSVNPNHYCLNCRPEIYKKLPFYPELLQCWTSRGYPDREFIISDHDGNFLLKKIESNNSNFKDAWVICYRDRSIFDKYEFCIDITNHSFGVELLKGLKVKVY
jgi:hypothetical protein